MHRFVFLLYLFLGSLPAIMGQSMADSLRQELEITQNSEKKVKLLNALTKAYLNSSLGDAEEYANSAVNIAVKTKNKKAQANALNNLGTIYLHKSQLDTALGFYYRALGIRTALNDTIGMSATTGNMGIVFEYKNNYPKAYDLYVKSLELAKLVNDSVGIAITYGNIANIFYYQGEVEKALEFYQKCLHMQKAMGNYSGVAMQYSNIGNIYETKGILEKSLQYQLESLKIADSLNNRRVVAQACHNIANVLNQKGEYLEAIDYLNRELEIYKDFDDKYGIAIAYNSLGIYFEKLGSTKEALDYHFKSLKIREHIGDKTGIAATLSNIGIIFLKQGNHKDALVYYKKADSIYNKLGRTEEMALMAQNIATVYITQGNYSEALSYLNTSDSLYKVVGDKLGIASVNMRKAEIQVELDEVDKAIGLLHQSLRVFSKHETTKEIADCNLYMGRCFVKKKAFGQALKYFVKAKDLAESIGDIELRRNTAQQLSEVYYLIGDFKKAYDFKSRYQELNDSIINKKSIRNIARMELQHAFDKQQKEQELIQKEKELEHKMAMKRQKMVRNYFLSGFILVLMLVLVVYRSYLQKQKANKLLQDKNNEITEQNEEIVSQRNYILNQNKTLLYQKEEITASIKYAKRIQEAVLPTKNQLDDMLSNYFVLFKPRDIVSGDFYWARKIDNLAVFVAADCTGHGVPGAFMSMLGVSLLNEIVVKKEAIDPGDLLNWLREKVKTALKQEGKASDQKDGMDLSLIVLDTSTGQLRYAGANNSLYLIKNKGAETSFKPDVPVKELTENNKTLYEIKADRQPVSVYVCEKPFISRALKIEKNDTIYMFSDGYADQPGGDKGRKFMTRKFKKLLLEITDKDMNEQHDYLNTIIEGWKNQYEQVDDILVVGIKL